jgi:hypothetical protein
MSALDFLVAFNLGLISTLHCWGMCGPIITAFSLGLPDQNASLGRIIMFNSGRISSYAVAGIIAGLIGAGIIEVIRDFHGQLILQMLAALVLVGIGLHVGGWFPQFRRIEIAGIAVWKHLQPLTRALLPVDTALKAYAAGLVWGWLPCGLVYSVLLWNLAGADPLASGLNMLGFGLGTLPGMITAGYTARKTADWLNKPHLRRVLGILVIAAGLISAWAAIRTQSAVHADHHHPAPKLNLQVDPHSLHH